MTKKEQLEETIEVEAKAAQLYLLSALVQDEKTLKQLGEIIGKANIKKEESLGKKRLSFPINKHSELTLVSIFFEETPVKVRELEKTLATEEEIERFLITRWNAEIPSERTSKKPKNEEESK